jgi:hypothetical protein
MLIALEVVGRIGSLSEPPRHLGPPLPPVGFAATSVDLPASVVGPPQPPISPPQPEIGPADAATFTFTPVPPISSSRIQGWLDEETSRAAAAGAPVPRGIRCRVVLKGNAITNAAGNPLDGNAFGVRRPETTFTDLVLPSGDGVKGGDFESWFFLNVPPTVVAVTPGSGQHLLSSTALTQVSVHFSRAMDMSTVTTQTLYVTDASGNQLSGTSVGPDPTAPNTIAVLSLAAGQAFAGPTGTATEAAYTVVLATSKVVAADGMPMDSAGGDFHSTFSIDTPTVVTAIDPPHDATLAQFPATVSLTFSRQLQSGAQTNAVTVTGPGGPVAGALTMPSAAVVTWTPQSVSQHPGAYTVQLVGGNVRDVNGLPILDFSSSFTVTKGTLKEKEKDIKEAIKEKELKEKDVLEKNLAEKLSDAVKGAEKDPAEKISDKLKETDKALTEKLKETDKVAEKAKETDKVAEKAKETDKVAEKAKETDKVAEKAKETDKIAEKAKETDKVAEKAKETDKVAEKAKETDKVAEKAKDIDKAAEKVKEKEVEKTLEKATDKVSDKVSDVASVPLVVPAVLAAPTRLARPQPRRRRGRPQADPSRHFIRPDERPAVGERIIQASDERTR